MNLDHASSDSWRLLDGGLPLVLVWPDRRHDTLGWCVLQMNTKPAMGAWDFWSVCSQLFAEQHSLLPSRFWTSSADFHELGHYVIPFQDLTEFRLPSSFISWASYFYCWDLWSRPSE